jgi:hypothetical protein
MRELFVYLKMVVHNSCLVLSYIILSCLVLPFGSNSLIGCFTPQRRLMIDDALVCSIITLIYSCWSRFPSHDVHHIFRIRRWTRRRQKLQYTITGHTTYHSTKAQHSNNTAQQNSPTYIFRSIMFWLILIIFIFNWTVLRNLSYWRLWEW